MAELKFPKPTKFFCQPDDSKYNSFFCDMEIFTSRMEYQDAKKVLQLIQNFLLTYTRSSSSEVSLGEPTMSDSDESYSETDYEEEEVESTYCEDEVSSTDSNDGLTEVSDCVGTLIWEHVKGNKGMWMKMKKAWKLRYEDADVIFHIPAQKCPNDGGLSVGLKWD